MDKQIKDNLDRVEYYLWHVIANWGRVSVDNEVAEDLAKAYNLLNKARGDTKRIKRKENGWSIK